MSGDAPALETGFPVARCDRCACDVLTHVQVDARGAESRRCLHCDADIDPREIRWVAETDLGRLGYGIDDGDGGCTRTGCSRGKCSNPHQAVQGDGETTTRHD